MELHHITAARSRSSYVIATLADSLHGLFVRLAEAALVIRKAVVPEAVAVVRVLRVRHIRRLICSAWPNHRNATMSESDRNIPQCRNDRGHKAAQRKNKDLPGAHHLPSFDVWLQTIFPSLACEKMSVLMLETPRVLQVRPMMPQADAHDCPCSLMT